MRKATQQGFAKLLAMLIFGLFVLAGCGSDGSDGKDGAPGEPGAPGAPGELGQVWQETSGAVNVSFTVSGATGGSGEFRDGDTMTVVVQAKNAYGYDMDPADLNQLALRINGPRSNVNTTTVPAKLLGGSVSANGSVTVNNVNLLTAATYDAAAKTWTYKTQPISDEGAGTYTVAVQAQGPLDQDGVRRAQDFELQDVQIKTALVDDLTIERFKCAACHLGANNGKFYLHHIDGGDWARDSNPVRNCKNCHNNSAVAGYNVCALAGTEGDLVLRDTDIASRNPCPTGYVQTRRADNIVNRVHGIHMGQDRRGMQLNADGTAPASHPKAWKPRNTANKRGLQNPRNIAYAGSKLWNSTETDADGNAHGLGNFRNFAAVGFPSDVRNCEKCHADTAWKEKPSRLACGTCHDNVNFSFAGARSAFEPRYGKCDDGGAFVTDANGRPQCVNAGATYVGEIAHPGGRQLDDTQCYLCHQDGGMAPIAYVHAKPVPTSGAPRVNNKAGKFTVETTWSGKAGAYYVAGEAPVLTVVIKQGGTPIDHTTVTQANLWTVNAWLSGPRAKKMPVLSSAARADITSRPGPFDFGGGGLLEIELDGGANDAAGVGSTNGVTASVNLAGAMTAAQVAAALNADPVFKSKGVAYTLDADTGVPGDAATLKIRTKPNHGYSGLRVLNGAMAAVLFDNGSDTDAFNDAGKQYDLFTTNAHRSASGTYSEFQLHLRSATNGFADPKLTLTPEGLVYRFDTIDDSVPAGTYTLAMAVNDVDSTGTGTTPITYYTELVQIKTGTEEKLIASNCKSCHDYDKRWHENAPRGDGYPFSTNYCGSCHDYKQQRGGKNAANGLPYSWLSSSWGFGAQPHSKRLHGLHFGNYLLKPAEVHSAYQIGKVIYPVDARNCEKCHATATSAFSTANQYNVMGVQRGVRDANATVLATWANGPFQAGKGGTAAEVEAGTADFEITSGSNVSNPTRIACNGCHDSDAAIAHTTLMTIDPTPANPFSGDESESCATCHGANRDFAVSTGIMNVNTPFQFPYVRRPSWMQQQ